MNLFLCFASLHIGCKTDFCIGVAGYPEKHLESPNMDTDIYYLKRKLDLGAHYVTTQMFFNNQHYYNYIARCREHGVEVPIVPGLKPLTSKRQMTMIPSVFNAEVPLDFYNEMMKAKSDKDCEQIGEEWLLEQCKDLLKNKVPVLYFYTLGKPNVIYNVLKRLF